VKGVSDIQKSPQQAHEKTMINHLSSTTELDQGVEANMCHHCLDIALEPYMKTLNALEVPVAFS